MKLTKANVLTYVRHQLGTNPVWAVKALVRIFQENQTADEQVSEATKHDNGVGFTGTDAMFLSSLAKAQLQHGHLTDKQMVYVFRKMPKYARQVVAMSNQEQLYAMVAKSANI